MKYSLMLLPFLATAASAQEDVWKQLAKGDRVQITFRSGNMIMGTLDNKPMDPRLKPGAVDYSAVNEVTLDVSLEYPGLNKDEIFEEVDRFYRAYYLRPKPILRIIKTMLEDKDIFVRRCREGYEFFKSLRQRKGDVEGVRNANAMAARAAT